MVSLTRVFGCPLPITENVAFEAFQVLTEESEERGSFDRMELHLLRIGQDLIHRAGLPTLLASQNDELDGRQPMVD